MLQKIFISVCGLVIGVFGGYFSIFYQQPASLVVPYPVNFQIPELDFGKRQRIGFLPYWLLSSAQNDYSPYITTLTFFGLTLENTGHIKKRNTPQEMEPGWYALQSGGVTPFLEHARERSISLSLLVFAGEEETIRSLMEHPTTHAQNLLADVAPIMKEHKFTDLNLDIESFTVSSHSSQIAFARFVTEVKRGLKENGLGTLTIDVAPDSLINPRLIHLPFIADLVDYVVLMGYDYHYSGSRVTGPVAPLYGAGTISEYDIDVAIGVAQTVLPNNKIILGLPLYGYEWETLRDKDRSAVIPGSGLTASTKRVETVLSQCNGCTVQTDVVAHEQYLIYPDMTTGTYHQIFYPDHHSMQAKLDYAKENKLGGIALWALGYEDTTILEPLKAYK